MRISRDTVATVGFTVTDENGQVVGAEGLDGITNQGELCLKGLHGYDFINDTKILTPRIYHPMIRREKGAHTSRHPAAHL